MFADVKGSASRKQFIPVFAPGREWSGGDFGKALLQQITILDSLALAPCLERVFGNACQINFRPFRKPLCVILRHRLSLLLLLEDRLIKYLSGTFLRKLPSIHGLKTFRYLCA